MDCDRSAQLLPWYLNQSLSQPEHEQIERHLATCEACRAELAETQAAYSLFGGHLPAPALVGYAFGSTGGEMPREVIEAHLADCRRCRAELALVRESRRELEAEEVAEERASRAGPVPLGRPDRVAPRVAAGWRIASLAASIAFVATLGAWIWSGPAGGGDPDGLRRRLAELQGRSEELAGQVVASQREIGGLRERLADLTTPRLGVPIVDLWPEATVLRGDASPDAGVIERRGPLATLILNSELEPGTVIERLEVRSGDTVHYALDGLARDPAAALTLSLPLSDLPAGPLAIALYARGGVEPVERFDFELR